ncbi:MAG: nickel-dependent lactate racemase [Bacteroidales bacterium]|nr:nickel-dependent lactate racemase [Bacteroidales bacterium]
MMDFELRYGNEVLSFPLKEDTTFLKIREPVFNISEKDFKSSVKEYLDSGSKDYSNIGIVISDKTRLCDYPLYLPWLLEVLEDDGAKPDSITLYIAYGTHPRQKEEESISSYGNIYKKYRFVHHDCNDMSLFKNLGKTKRGTPVMIRKDILDSTMLITFGAISHHYFAGFGGGRKLLFPGLGEKNAIYHNHSLFLNLRDKKLEEGCQPGKLTNNPVAEDLREINDLLPERLSIHGILNSKGKVCQFLFGKNYDDFRRACQLHDHFFKSQSDRQFDLVIASGGGYPKDINFIQAHKSVHHAAAFVSDSGVLVILAECRDGIGTDTFLPLFRETGWNQMFEKLSQKYEGNGGTALAMKAKSERIQIHMMTKMDEEICQLMGVKKTNAGQIRKILANHKGSMAVIDNASMLIR